MVGRALADLRSQSEELYQEELNREQILFEASRSGASKLLLLTLTVGKRYRFEKASFIDEFAKVTTEVDLVLMVGPDLCVRDLHNLKVFIIFIYD